MSLNQLAKEVHEIATSKGFHDNKVTVPHNLMLVVSELGEVSDAHRKGKRADLEKYNEWQFKDGERFNTDPYYIHIKNTIEDEVADVFIYMLDFCAEHNIDIEKHIEIKNKYNLTREKLHGKQY